MTSLPIATLTVDPGCQPRASMEPPLVDEYADAMRSGASFPSVTVFRDGGNYWLADGFHRVAAAKRAGLLEVPVEVFDGDRRDAILYSVGANATHGKRRSNLDKRKAVETLLNDPEWSQWSSWDISRRCSVSHTFVDNMRASLATVASEAESSRTYTDKHGNTSTMNVSNIGKTPTMPKVHGSLPADILGDFFGGDVEDAEPEQAPLSPAINWDEGDRKAADSAIRCREFVGNYDAQRVAYAVAATSPDYREKVMTEAIELRLWLGELTHQLNKLK